eukprot:TRINITY_DN7162_c0_g2_i2.p1 TRINITY_DN7162_c0_g2~~TRINITY_DN7162_c0_g2_i2.p1  ORF type:complete len:1004 (+),score=135.30 TRINITY_DN7162_c0_g2_i2:105-3116(+)
MKALGFHTDVSSQMVLRALRKLSTDCPRYMNRENLDFVWRAYRKLDLEVFSSSPTDLRSLFDEHSLVLWHKASVDEIVAEGVSVKWLKPSQVRWEANDQENMHHYAQDVHFLEPIYGKGLASFFCEKVHVTLHPSWRDRVSMLQDLERQDYWKGWSETDQRRVEFLYIELSRDCRLLESRTLKKRRHDNLTQEDDIQFEDLRNQRIFRTVVGTWASASSGLLVPDDDDLLDSVQGHAIASTIIAISPSQSQKLKYLAESLGIGFLTQNVAQHVTDDSASSCQEHVQWSQCLQRVVEPAARCAFHVLLEQLDEDQRESKDCMISSLCQQWQGLPQKICCKVAATLQVVHRLTGRPSENQKHACEHFADVRNSIVYLSQELAHRLDAEICSVLASLVVKILVQDRGLAIARREMLEMQVNMLLMVVASDGDTSVMFERNISMKQLAALPTHVVQALRADGDFTFTETGYDSPAREMTQEHGMNHDEPVAGESSRQSPCVDTGLRQANSEVMQSGRLWQEPPRDVQTKDEPWSPDSAPGLTSSDQPLVDAHAAPGESASSSHDQHFAKVDSEFPGMFWLMPRSQGLATLCINCVSQTIPDELWRQAHHFMTRMLGHSDFRFHGRAETNKLNEAFSTWCGGLFWKSCSGRKFDGRVSYGVGMGRNKKEIERASKLALAFTLACQQGSERDEECLGPFHEYVVSLRSSLQLYKSLPSLQDSQTWEHLPKKRKLNDPVFTSAKRSRHNIGDDEDNDAADLRVVESELKDILKVELLEESGDYDQDVDLHEDNNSMILDKSASAIGSIMAQGLVQITRSLLSAGGSVPQIVAQSSEASFVADMLRTEPELRASLESASSKYSREVHRMYYNARQIFKQNFGPQVLLGQRPDIVSFEEKTMLVSELHWSHDSISSVFRHGAHSGEPVSTLIEELNDGSVQPCQIPSIIVAPFDGKVFAVTGNRRLYALKRHAEHVQQDILVNVLAVRHLCPLTAKFLMSFSTCNGGTSVQT